MSEFLKKLYRTFLKLLDSFQSRVYTWAMLCFPPKHIFDKNVRNVHFLEEALELVQALGLPEEEAIRVVRYVYSRSKGHPPQEVGGVLLTLSLLSVANELDMLRCGEDELERVWMKIDVIREKQKHKPH